MTALLPTRANTFGGTKRARSEACPQQLHCACASPTGVWRAACVPPQSERAGAKLVTVTTTTTGGQSVATSPPSPPEPTPSPDGRPRSRVTVRLARGPARPWSRRGRRFRGDAARSRAVHGRSSSVWPRPRRRGCSRACVSVPGTAERWPASR